MANIKGVTPPKDPARGLQAAKLRALGEIKKRANKKGFLDASGKVDEEESYDSPGEDAQEEPVLSAGIKAKKKQILFGK